MCSLNLIDNLPSKIISAFMRILFKLFTITLIVSCNKKEDSQEQITNYCIGEYTAEEIQDTIVSAFFGLDNALPSLFLCN